MEAGMQDLNDIALFAAVVKNNGFSARSEYPEIQA
jgi:hypothetical protein